ncbi:hypothetical protein OG21DRAFT_920677 [Imleria badia]|nr:hypothetical protein OG21DRAFT_920677 [Imleria badia]
MQWPSQWLRHSHPPHCGPDAWHCRPYAQRSEPSSTPCNSSRTDAMPMPHRSSPPPPFHPPNLSLPPSRPDAPRLSQWSTYRRLPYSGPDTPVACMLTIPGHGDHPRHSWSFSTLFPPSVNSMYAGDRLPFWAGKCSALPRINIPPRSFS